MFGSPMVLVVTLHFEVPPTSKHTSKRSSKHKLQQPLRWRSKSSLGPGHMPFPHVSAHCCNHSLGCLVSPGDPFSHLAQFDLAKVSVPRTIVDPRIERPVNSSIVLLRVVSKHRAISFWLLTHGCNILYYKL